MAIKFGDPDETNPDLRKALNESFQDYLPEQFRNEYPRPPKNIRKEKKPKVKKIKTWDDLMRKNEKRQILDLDVPTRPQCIYLDRESSSNCFYYCSPRAEDFHLRGESKYSKCPKTNCAEFKSRVNIHELEQHCLGSNHCYCEIYEMERERIENLQKKFEQK